MQDFDWSNLINPDFYINLEIGGVQIGIYIVLFIVFAETGLFAGFFLPGDSLLFLSGIYSTSLMSNIVIINSEFWNLFILSLLVTTAGILGNSVGYWFGQKSGIFLFKKEDTFWFRKKYLLQAKDFFEKYGGKAIIYARFLPILRTFAPIVAGIVGMDKKKFVFYNIVSSFAWAYSLIFAGHYLQGFFLTKGIDLKHYIEYIIIIIVLISTMPVLVKFLKSPKKKL